MFLQPDSLVPDPYNPLDWNRFLFVRANPINFNDPSGHFPVTIVAGLGIGAIVGGVIYGATTIASGRDFQASELLVSIGVGAAGGALIGTGVGASAGVAAMASIGAGTGVIGSQIGYSATSGKEFESSKLVATSAVGGVTGAATGVLGAPTGINPVSNQALAFGARMAVNGVSGGIDYALSEAMSKKTSSIDGLKISVGVGLTAGLVGEALPGYKSQTLDFYGGQVFQRSPVTAYNEFNGTLRSFAQKELLWQGVDDAIRSGGVSALTNYLNENLK